MLELATGEVRLGHEALELGLVDEIGDLERAIEFAAKLAGCRPRPHQYGFAGHCSGA